jgi:hypothetical protein
MNHELQIRLARISGGFIPEGAYLLFLNYITSQGADVISFDHKHLRFRYRAREARLSLTIDGNDLQARLEESDGPPHPAVGLLNAAAKECLNGTWVITKRCVGEAIEQAKERAD